jgi:hypothetical protein
VEGQKCSYELQKNIVATEGGHEAQATETLAQARALANPKD